MIKIYRKEKNTIEVRRNQTSNLLIINDDFIKNILEREELPLDTIQNWDMYIEGEDIYLEIRNYTVFNKTISIHKSGAGKAKINALKADAHLHLVGLNIDIIQYEDCNLLLADCKVNEIDFEIRKAFSRNRIERKYQDYRIDIRSSTIKELNIYHSLSHLNIQKSTIENIEFTSWIDEVNSVDGFRIWEGCKINLLRMNCKIENFNIENSNVSRLYFTKNSFINEYKISKSFYDKVFGCEKNNFEKLEIDELKLIKQSSIEENDSLYFDVSYELAKLKGKKEHNFANWFLKNSIGYGYKPLKSLKFIIISIMTFAATYSLVDLIEYLSKGYKLAFDNESLRYIFLQFIDRIYFSGITFTTTGYGDITPNNIAIKFIAVAESCLGVVMFSLLIYSLTVRHLTNK